VESLAEVRFHRFGTNDNREIATINQEFYLRLTVSPYRKSILITAWNPAKSENVMIVDNFRVEAESRFCRTDRLRSSFRFRYGSAKAETEETLARSKRDSSSVNKRSPLAIA
jgi:hypothetical protein